MAAIQVLEYLREDGSNPYKKWFDALDVLAAAKVSTAKMELGNTSSIKWFEGIGECKIDWGPGIRNLSGQGRRGAHRPIWRWNEAYTEA